MYIYLYIYKYIHILGYHVPRRMADKENRKSKRSQKKTKKNRHLCKRKKMRISQTIPIRQSTPNIQIHPLHNNIHVSKVYCGSAFEPGASGLPYYCTSICVRFWCNWRANLWIPNKKQSKISADIGLRASLWIPNPKKKGEKQKVANCVANNKPKTKARMRLWGNVVDSCLAA